MPSFLSPILRSPSQKFSLKHVQSGAIVATDLLPAFDRETRNRGLLRHESLPPATAIVLAPTFAVHTFFMRFPIDVAFVTRDGAVTKIAASVKPWRIALQWGAFAVLEMQAGSFAAAGLRPGDVVTLIAT